MAFKRSWLLVLGSLVLALVPMIGQAAGWRNDGTGHFLNCQPPPEWTQANQRWTIELPGTSLSSPTLVGEYVFTMAEPTELICVSASDGSVLWKRSHNYSDFLPAEQVKEITAQHEMGNKVRQKIEEVQKTLKAAQERKAPVEETKAIEAQIAELNSQYENLTPFPPPSTDSTGNTTSTPFSDGKYVWCVFANGICSCHDLQGNRQWMAFVEKPSPRHTSSPVLAGRYLIVHLNHLVAIEPTTGKVVWKTETPPRMGTAAIAKVGQDEFIVTAAGTVIRARDGKLMAEKLFDLPYCSPIAHGDLIYAVERGKIKAIQLKSKEDALDAESLWEARGVEGDQLASPVVHDGLLYTVTGNGILDVIAADSGERVHRKRLDVGQGRVDSSLAIAGDLLFVGSTTGKFLALKPGREFKEVSQSEIEGTSSSPFFSGDCAFLRTPKHLICIATP